MRIIFAGTPDIAATVLQALIDSDHEIVRVLTRPDAPVGRRRTLTPSPVAALALSHGLPVAYADRVTPEVVDDLRETDAELGVVVAYGAILSDAALAVPAHGWINLHVSLLPAWRGAAPVQRSIEAGDEEIGYSVIGVTHDLDAGDIYAQEVVSGLAEATADEVLEQLGRAGAPAVLDVVDAIASGTAASHPQHGTVTVARKLDRDFGRVDWTQSAQTVFNRWRAATSEPGAWTTLDEQPLKVLELALAHREVPAAPAGTIEVERRAVYVAASDGWLQLLRVQAAGRTPAAARDWANGLRGQAGVLR